MFSKSLQSFRLFEADTGAAGTDTDSLDSAHQAENIQEDNSEANAQEAELKYSDKDVNDIIAAKFAKWEKQRAKQESEAERLAGMSDDERATEERKALEEKASSLQAELDKRNMRDTARSLFNAANVDVSDADLSLVVTPEAEPTKANVNQLIDLAKRIRKSVEKDFLSGDPIKRGAGKATKAGSLGAQLAQKQVQAAANQHKFFEN